MAKLLYMGWASKVRLFLQYPLLPHVGVYDLNMCEASQRGWCNRCLGEHFFGTTVYNFFLLVVESLVGMPDEKGSFYIVEGHNLDVQKDAPQIMF